jgi:succinate-semialdehyde dehydrogenase/glutarate-semialdehyde dehydrogenase
MLALKDPTLLKTSSYIGGKWREGASSFPVKNPFDGKTVATVTQVGEKETNEAIEIAQKGFEMWKGLTAKQRGEYLKKWELLIYENWDDISTILTYESGKPLEQASHELMGCTGFLNWYAQEAQRLYGYTLQSPDSTRRFMTLRQPIGVVGVICPWNFPSVLVIQKCAPALAAGCSVVLKPAEETPLSALVHAELAHRAGIPPGVFNVLTCQDPTKVGETLTTHPLVRKLSFTGSTEVGKKLMTASGSSVKNLCMELGGNCPAIIFEDADLGKALPSTFWFKFYNAGQCCNNINRIFIHESLYDQYIEKFKKMIDEYLTLGAGIDEKSNLGPLINEAGMIKVERLVKDALEKGATAIRGGARSPLSPLLYEPTLLVDATSDMQIYREEVFGPVACCYRFKTDEEVIKMANDTPYGLAAYLYTENISRSWKVTEKLEAGSVGVNTHDVVSELLPFGGWKQSGIGRENSAIESLHGYCETKSVVIGGI